MALDSQDASSAIELAELGVVLPVGAENSIRLGVGPIPRYPALLVGENHDTGRRAKIRGFLRWRRSWWGQPL